MIYESGDRIAADFFESGHLLKLEKKTTPRSSKNNKSGIKVAEEKLYKSAE